ncbi:MAG: phospholipase D-like domain-containing protein [Elainellaceae cyanobacterium]
MLTLIATIALIAGISCFLTLYAQGFFRRRRSYSLQRLPNPADEGFTLTLASLSDSFRTQGRITGFWLEADAIFNARLTAIRQARRSIQFETFIMTPGRRASDFADALIEQAEAGVNIQLVVDHYGTKSIPNSYWKRLRSAGIEVRFFNPFDWRSPFDYLDRTHRKLLLIDQVKVLIGGAGVSDMWDGKEASKEGMPWLDFEVCFEGETAAFLEGIFLQHWLDAGGVIDLEGKTFKAFTNHDSDTLITSGEDPTLRDSSVRSLLQTLTYSAQTRLWLASPYLLPNDDFRKGLLHCKKKGVDVRLLTMSACTDKSYVYYASREMYRDLLEAGIQIFEYQPSMLHSKTILIDDSWISFGSANFDSRSFFHNDELNLSTKDAGLVQKIEQFFELAFSRSQAITRQRWQQRPLWHRFLGQCSLLLRHQL